MNSSKNLSVESAYELFIRKCRVKNLSEATITSYNNKVIPLLSYYRGIAIEAIDDLQDMKVTGTDICSTVRIKARQEILNKHYKNKHGRMVYPYDKFECAGDIKKTEKLLFTFYDENLVDDTALDFVEVDEELEALFGQKEKEIWGAPEPNADAEEIERILG